MLDKSDFASFYRALHGFAPFPWQEALLEQIWKEGDWPEVIDLPTGAGKTSCIDIALFQMAASAQPKWRRIFFVVDRRIIVSEVAERARKIAAKLDAAPGGILRQVQEQMMHWGGGLGLKAVEMRGGIYQDKSWIGNPLQAMVIASTVDQVGSRLLFRGYGVPEGTAPIHAAMVGKDSLIFLDEAHCSKAFAQTLERVRQYQSWNREACGNPLRVVEMTATPSREVSEVRRFVLTPKDESAEITPLLARRLFSAKPTELLLVPKTKQGISVDLADKAEELYRRSGGGATGVLVNRVQTAKDVAGELSKRFGEDKVILLIGRMRPLDAMGVQTALSGIKTEAGGDRSGVHFVVATQCLEVGADLDFDALVSECASLDALQQRFGRLDRAGRLAGKALGAILCAANVAESKDPDPIYGDCLKNTWHWLNSIASEGRVDFGLRASGVLPNVASIFATASHEEKQKLRRQGEEACVLLPAHLDALCQTAPTPHVEPDVSVFLHGAVEASLDVQVVWRMEVLSAEKEARQELAVLGNEEETKTGLRELWEQKLKQALTLCPPSSLEAMPVRIFDLRAWIQGLDVETPDADLEGLEIPPGKPKGEKALSDIYAFLWKGRESRFVSNPRQIRPGDTIVVDVSSSRNLEQLGYIPAAGLVKNSEGAIEVRDQADEVARLRQQVRVRLHERLFHGVETGAIQKLLQSVAEEEGDLKALRLAIAGTEGVPNPFAAWNERVKADSRIDAYLGGYLVRGKTKPEKEENWLSLEEDAGEDSGSFGPADSLLGHTALVRHYAEELSAALAPQFREAYRIAANWHDVGKADVRFQTMLCEGNRLRAELLGDEQLLAKSEYRSNLRGELPQGFRHEMVSLQFAEEHGEFETERDLALHLIASHHGHARPLAPVVFDREEPSICFQGKILRRKGAKPIHDIGSGCGERFWSLTRRFGWWGLAYLESVFRLADWRASRESLEEKRNATVSN